ncbi:low-density lipoprotein receptor-related protein 8-like [Ptychodera flava]|uniref:low-density lipoprotein receptor-related protein 8-like n=1 Tax=Ptychodera flava TaxID=63121 RepID=UPI00396A3404
MCGRGSGPCGIGMVYISTMVPLLFTVISGQSVTSPGLLIAVYEASNQTSYIRYIAGDISSIYQQSDNLDSLILSEDLSSRKIGISYDFEQSLLFWADTLRNDVVKLSLLDGSLETLYHETASSLEDVAVDWSAHNVYFADSANQRIMVCNYTGYCHPVVTDVDNVSSLAVEPSFGYLYWSSKGTSPKVERSSLLGENRKVIVSPESVAHGVIHTPLGLVIGYSKRSSDLTSVQRIFWLDQFHKTYLSANLDGSETHIDYPGDDSYKTPVDLDLTSDYYIVSDLDDQQIKLVDRGFPILSSSISFDNEQPTSAVFLDGSRQTVIPVEKTTQSVRVTTPVGDISLGTSPETPAKTLSQVSRRGSTTRGLVTYASMVPAPREGATAGVSSLHSGLIAAAATAVVIVVVIIVVCLIRRRRRRKPRRRNIVGYNVDIVCRPLPDEPVYASISEGFDEFKDGLTQDDIPTGRAQSSAVYQPLLKSNMGDTNEESTKQNGERPLSEDDNDYSYQKMTAGDDAANSSPANSYVNVNGQSEGENSNPDNFEYIAMEGGLGGKGVETEAADDAVPADCNYVQPENQDDGEESSYVQPGNEDEESIDYDNQNPKGGELTVPGEQEDSSEQAEPYIEILSEISDDKPSDDKISEGDSITYC